MAVGWNVPSSAAAASAGLWPAAVALRSCQSQTALTSFWCDFKKTHPWRHMPDTGVRAKPSVEVEKEFAVHASMNLFQYNTLSHLVENNCLKSGAQGYQISSLESLEIQLHFCGSSVPEHKFYAQELNSLFCWVKTGSLTWPLNGTSCKFSVFISMQACLDWSFDSDTILSGANTNLP